MVRPGVTFRELTFETFVPDIEEFHHYTTQFHGVGMAMDVRPGGWPCPPTIRRVRRARVAGVATGWRRSGRPAYLTGSSSHSASQTSTPGT